MSRDPVDWPFLASSIWNMPIGSGAIFAPAGLNGVGAMPFPIRGDATFMRMPGRESERLVLSPASPERTVAYSNVGWSGGNRCNATGGSVNNLPITVPIPDSYTVASSTRNESAAFLLSDGVSVRECQPLARCTAAGNATAIVASSTVNYSILGSGLDLNGGLGMGAHGGSRLLALGGTIRFGEMRPGDTTGPKHALKFNMCLYEVGYNASVSTDAHRWPATAHDGYWNSGTTGYGVLHNNTNSQMKMGSLLAIPGTVDIDAIGLETECGWQLAWTCQNYGGYIVDDTFTGQHWYIAVDDGAQGSFNTQFLSDYGFNWENFYNNGANAWTRDCGRIYQQLQVVTNNTATSIGGGGVPRVDYAPLMETA